jgi:hypothetical protein
MTDDTIEAILSALTIDAIRASTVATCVLLDPDAACVEPVVLTPPRDLAPEGCLLLKSLLLDPQSWFFAKKRCLPRPTALFRLQGEQGSVSVTVGFACVGWIVVSSTHRQGGFFDPVAGEVRELLKAVFPEFASRGRRSMWRAGIIAELRRQREKGRAEPVVAGDTRPTRSRAI